MKMKVQRQKPNRKDGEQGEMRLVMMGGGSWLYIKGGNQWHTLTLLPAEAISLVNRRKRGDLQRNILAVADANSDDDYDGAGSIVGPGGGGGATPPDAPL